MGEASTGERVKGVCGEQSFGICGMSHERDC